MKSEQEIQERIDRYEERLEDMVQGSPDWSRIAGKRDALQWVIRHNE